METCEFCGEEAKYKITTKLNPNSVSYACKDCLDKKTKEMQEQLNDYIKNMSNNSFLGGIMKQTSKHILKSMMHVEKL